MHNSMMPVITAISLFIVVRFSIIRGGTLFPDPCNHMKNRLFNLESYRLLHVVDEVGAIVSVLHEILTSVSDALESRLD